MLEYQARTIPATGVLETTHTYLTTRSAAELDAPAPKPHGGGATLPSRRRGVRALTRKRRLHLSVTLAARAGGEALVTRVRRLTIRLP